jgi:diguanylate cyclase (GGDEF)-like protein
LPRDPFFYAHVAAVVAATAWLTLGPGLVPVGVVAIAILASVPVYLFVRERRTHDLVDALHYPWFAFVADLAFGALWMIASARGERSITFVVVLFVGALGAYSYGRRALALTVAAYVVGRVGMEWARMSAGIVTPPGQFFSEIGIILLAVLTFAATLSSFGRVRGLGDAALRRATSLERVARELAAATEPIAVLRSIPQSALSVVPADYAAIVLRSGQEWEVLAGAGLAEKIVGMRRDASEGVFGEVLAKRSTIVHDDYVRHPRAVASVVELGIRTLVGLPIFVSGEVAACLTVGRTGKKPVDVAELAALSGLTAHASIALANARSLQLARRLEGLTARFALQDSADKVLEVAAREAAEAFNTDFAYIVAIESTETRMVGGVGAAGELIGRRYDRPGPLTKRVIEGREQIAVRDYVREFPIDLGDEPIHIDRGGRRGSAGLIAREVGIHAIVSTPLIVADAVAAVLVVGTNDPSRTFDELDRQGMIRLAEISARAFENLAQLSRMRDLYLATVKALAAAVDARDPYTRSHSARVAALARLIGEEMHLSEDEVRQVQLGALLHDLGKIGIPDAILNKPGPLLPEEWAVMRTHPALGASILEGVEPLADLVPIVRDHHEYYDGRGYPRGTAGEEVGILAYVVAVADAYEVIVTQRSYKEAQSVEEALDELRRCRGTQFHPDVVDAFIKVIERDVSEGARLLARVGALQQEEIDDVPGPGDVVQRYVARAQNHGRRLAVLQRLAGEIGSVLDLDDLAGRLLRIVCDAMGYEHGFLATVDRDSGQLIVRAAFGPSLSFVGSHIPPGAGISAWVLEHARLQNVGDASTDPRFYGPADVRSSLIVPLKVEDEVLGVLGIESPRRSAFTPEDEQLVTAVSHQISAAIRVANLHHVARNAAATDPLTGLANRRAFFERLEAALAAGGDDPLVTVVLADVDGLKALNDRHGHRAGDEGLVRISEQLMQGIRTGDVVARIGGDEFAVLFGGAPIFVAERVMQRISEGLATSLLSGGVRVPSLSWGMAQAAGRTTADEMLEVADRAMYRHKRQRRERLLRAE